MLDDWSLEFPDTFDANGKPECAKVEFYSTKAERDQAAKEWQSYGHPCRPYGYPSSVSRAEKLADKSRKLWQWR